MPECYNEPEEAAKLGDRCQDGCETVYEYRYDPTSTEHDFDGGSCWRCAALDPWLHEGTGPFAVLNQAEPTAEIPESMVREIVAALEKTPA